jgi:hypothetical protein
VQATRRKEDQTGQELRFIQLAPRKEIFTAGGQDACARRLDWTSRRRRSGGLNQVKTQDAWATITYPRGPGDATTFANLCLPSPTTLGWVAVVTAGVDRKVTRSVSMIRIGGREYPVRSSPRCFVCRSPHRLVIEEALLAGSSLKQIVARLPADCSLTQRSVRDHVKEGHLGLDELEDRSLVAYQMQTKSQFNPRKLLDTVIADALADVHSTRWHNARCW